MMAEALNEVKLKAVLKHKIFKFLDMAYVLGNPYVIAELFV
jgi:hypothetical protein